MNKIELLSMLTDYAKIYRTNANESMVQNNHMNSMTGETIQQEDIDALLVDFINFIGRSQGVDYALYTGDLKK